MTAVLYSLPLLLLFSLPAPPAQQVLRTKHDYFSTDNLGNMYLVNDAELLKYNAGGDLLVRYSNLKLGDIGSVDATNPLKILIYYPDYQQMLFLDNQLSPNGQPISLQELGLEQAAMVCAGANNSFWVFDSRNSELIRFDQNRKKIASTGNLRQVLNAEIKPVMMREHNNFLYLNCPETGIYVFDIFGAFSKLLPLKGIIDLQANKELIYYHKAGILCSYDQRLVEERCDSLPAGVRLARVAGDKKYLSYGDSILVNKL